METKRWERSSTALPPAAANLLLPQPAIYSIFQRRISAAPPDAINTDYAGRREIYQNHLPGFSVVPPGATQVAKRALWVWSINQSINQVVAAEY